MNGTCRHLSGKIVREKPHQSQKGLSTEFSQVSSRVCHKFARCIPERHSCQTSGKLPEVISKNCIKNLEKYRIKKLN